MKYDTALDAYLHLLRESAVADPRSATMLRPDICVYWLARSNEHDAPEERTGGWMIYDPESDSNEETAVRIHEDLESEVDDVLASWDSSINHDPSIGRDSEDYGHGFIARIYTRSGRECFVVNMAGCAGNSAESVYIVR